MQRDTVRAVSARSASIFFYLLRRQALRQPARKGGSEATAPPRAGAECTMYKGQGGHSKGKATYGDQRPAPSQRKPKKDGKAKENFGQCQNWPKASD